MRKAASRAAVPGEVSYRHRMPTAAGVRVISYSAVPCPQRTSSAPAGLVQGRERLVVVVVDLGEVAQFSRRQFLLCPEELQPARCIALPVEDIGHQLSISGPDLPDQHR